MFAVPFCSSAGAEYRPLSQASKRQAFGLRFPPPGDIHARTHHFNAHGGRAPQR